MMICTTYVPFWARVDPGVDRNMDYHNQMVGNVSHSEKINFPTYVLFFAFVGFCLRIWIDISIFYLLQNDYRQECPGCLLQRQALGFCWRLFSRLWNCQIYLNLLNTGCSPVAEHIFNGLKTPSNGRFLQCAPPSDVKIGL